MKPGDFKLIHTGIHLACSIHTFKLENKYLIFDSSTDSTICYLGCFACEFHFSHTRLFARI